MRREAARHRALIFILALHLPMAVLYGFVTPIYEGPDEIGHVLYVKHLYEGRGLPVQTREYAISYGFGQEGSQPPLYYLINMALMRLFDIHVDQVESSPQVNPFTTCGRPGTYNVAHYRHDPRWERFPYKGMDPSYTDVNGVHPVNFVHPKAEAALAVHVMRLFSALLGGLTVAAVYSTAWLAFSSRTPAILAAVLTAFNPQFAFMGGVVNNDNLVNCLTAIALALTMYCLRYRFTWQRTLLVGLVCGLAVMTKVGGLMALAFAYLGLLLGLMPRLMPRLLPGLMPPFWRWPRHSGRRDRVFRAARYALLLSVSFLLVAGWWFARNWILYGEPTGLERMTSIYGPRRSSPAELFFVELISAFRSYWATFVCDLTFPTPIYWLLALVVGAGIWGLVRTKGPDGLPSILPSGGEVAPPSVPPASGGEDKGSASGGEDRGTKSGGEGRGTTSGGEGRGTTSGGEGRGTKSGGEGRGATSGGEGRGTTNGGEGRSTARGCPKGAKRHNAWLLLAWTGLVFIAWVRWNWVNTSTSMGRLFFQANAAICTLLGYGLTRLTPRPRWVVAGIGSSLGLLTLAGALLVVRPAFALPPRYAAPVDGAFAELPRSLKSTDQSRVKCELRSLGSAAAPPCEKGSAAAPCTLPQAMFGTEIRALGYEVSPRSLEPGETLDIALFLQPTHPITDDYALALQLLSPASGDDTTLVNFNTIPGGGNYPTYAWQPGELIIDRYRLQIPERVERTQAWRIAAILYRMSDGQRLPVTVAGQPAEKMLGLGVVRVGASEPPPLPKATLKPNALFGDAVSPAIRLEAMWLRREDDQIQVQAWWRAESRPPGDYTALVHLYDGEGTLLASGDAPPLDGAFPTSLWEQDDLIVDEYVLPWEAKGEFVGLGWYDPVTGTRLRAFDAADRLAGDVYHVPVTP